jgi:hypothetical protein
MNSTGRMFILYSSNGTFTLSGCEITIPDEFISWEVERRMWNGTFMMLNNGSFSIIDTNFVNISINGTNAFIVSTVEISRAFVINNCTFTECGCVGDGIGSIKAPMNVEIKIGGSFKINETKFENCKSESSEVQLLYIKTAFYENIFMSKIIMLNCSLPNSNTVILIEIEDICTFLEAFLMDEDFPFEFFDYYSLNISINEISYHKLLSQKSSQDFTPRSTCNSIEECLWLEKNNLLNIDEYCINKVFYL